MTISDSQRDMRSAYYGGAFGMLSSALAWFAAAVVALRVSPERAVWVLFVGAMFIHPIAVLLNKAVGRTGSHQAGNPLGSLAMATTFWLILSCPLAYAASLVHIEWFFPAMLLVIGGRYFTFATLFGTRIYWVCGATLALAGYLLAKSQASPALGAFTGSAIEAVFACIIFTTARHEPAA